MRWVIEIYFKEIKQNMGFLKEQSPSYVSHYASIHLTAARYTLLLEGLLAEGDITFAKYKNKIKVNKQIKVIIEIKRAYFENTGFFISYSIQVMELNDLILEHNQNFNHKNRFILTSEQKEAYQITKKEFQKIIELYILYADKMKRLVMIGEAKIYQHGRTVSLLKVIIGDYNKYFHTKYPFDIKSIYLTKAESSAAWKLSNSNSAVLCKLKPRTL